MEDFDFKVVLSVILSKTVHRNVFDMAAEVQNYDVFKEGIRQDSLKEFITALSNIHKSGKLDKQLEDDFERSWRHFETLLDLHRVTIGMHGTTGDPTEKLPESEDVCKQCGVTKDYHDLALVPATAAGACDSFVSTRDTENLPEALMKETPVTRMSYYVNYMLSDDVESLLPRTEIEVEFNHDIRTWKNTQTESMPRLPELKAVGIGIFSTPHKVRDPKPFNMLYRGIHFGDSVLYEKGDLEITWS